MAIKIEQRTWALLLVLGLCSCASSYIPPAEGPTAKIKQIRYFADDLSAYTNLDVMIHDINEEGCLVNTQKVPKNDQGDLMIPANKPVGMRFLGTTSLDTAEVSYEATCDMRVGTEFEADTEYVINIRQDSQSCNVAIINALTFRPPVLKDVTSGGAAQGHCIERME